MRKLYTQMAVAMVLFAAVTAAGGQQMQPYTSTDGRFTVNFPQAEVKQESSTINLGGCTPTPQQPCDTTTLHQFWVELANNNVSYMVMYNDYPANYAGGDPQTTLTQTRDGALSGKTMLSDTVISLNGIPGREFTAKDDSYNYTVRQYLQGKRLYQMIVVSNAANPATQISDFMTSFKIQ
jgi:hypothetical protein